MFGVSFYKWGYWDVMYRVSLNEGIVVVVLIIVGWNWVVFGFGDVNVNVLGEECVLLDFMCGLGIFLIEVVFMVSNVVFGLMC